MRIVKCNHQSQFDPNVLKNSNIFHTPKYQKFTEEAFNCQYDLMGVEENNKVQTILPIVKIKNNLLGNKIISSAYIEYGGFAGDKKYFPELINHLNNHYKKDFGYLEIRGGDKTTEEVLSSPTISNQYKIIKQNTYKRFVLTLTNEEDIWKDIQKSKRKAVKKSLKNVQVKDVPFSDLNSLYKLYCHNMKLFGSPPYSKKYFKSFYKNIINNHLGKIIGSYHQGKLVSALVGFCYKERVHILIAISNPDYQKFRPNDAMHWEFIKWAIKNNYQYFDFGRVREESGQFEYKRKWGAELQELPSFFILWNNKEIPLVDPNSTKYQLFIKLWRIIPLPITKLIGPWLRKGLGI